MPHAPRGRCPGCRSRSHGRRARRRAGVGDISPWALNLRQVVDFRGLDPRLSLGGRCPGSTASERPDEACNRRGHRSCRRDQSWRCPLHRLGRSGRDRPRRSEGRDPERQSAPRSSPDRSRLVLRRSACLTGRGDPCLRWRNGWATCVFTLTQSRVTASSDWRLH